MRRFQNLKGLLAVLVVSSMVTDVRTPYRGKVEDSIPADLGMPVPPYQPKKSKGNKKLSRAQRKAKGK